MAIIGLVFAWLMGRFTLAGETDNAGRAILGLIITALLIAGAIRTLFCLYEITDQYTVKTDRVAAGWKAVVLVLVIISTIRVTFLHKLW